MCRYSDHGAGTEGADALKQEEITMPHEFRFLVLCREPINDGGVVTLRDVVSTISLSEGLLPCDIDLFAVVGAVLRDPMWGKPLDLMAWQLGNKGERETLVKYRGTPLILPEQRGAVVLPYKVKVPVWTSGIYGFDLFDREGAFGKTESVLATYLYAVDGR